jgi:hypothetical protein
MYDVGIAHEEGILRALIMKMDIDIKEKNETRSGKKLTGEEDQNQERSYIERNRMNECVQT